MNPHVTAVGRFVGVLLQVPAAMALFSVPIALVFGELPGVVGFIAVAILGAGLGRAVGLACRSGTSGGRYHAVLATAIAWLAVPLIGMLPFAVYAYWPEAPASTEAFRNLTNGVLESFSGFTATGVSVAESPSALPRSLQWWRSFTEWVGGLGVAVAVLALFKPGDAGYRLVESEGREPTIAPSVRSTVRTTGWIYVLFTSAATAALVAAGRPLWEAVNHSMTAIATGGFSVTDGSLASYAPMPLIVVVCAMVAGAVSFHAHHAVLVLRSPMAMIERIEHRVFLVCLVGGAALLVAVCGLRGGAGPGAAVFHWVSALTTTGFSTGSFDDWGVPEKLLLIAAMTIGGEAGATVGGIKMTRLAMLLRGMAWTLAEVRRSPREVGRYIVERSPISRAQAAVLVRSAAVLVAMWGASLFLGTLLLGLVLDGDHPLEDLLFEVASAMGNVGLSIGITGRDMPEAGKVILSLAMWIGRLEIIPVVLLVSTLTHPLRR